MQTNKTKCHFYFYQINDDDDDGCDDDEKYCRGKKHFTIIFESSGNKDNFILLLNNAFLSPTNRHFGSNHVQSKTET